MRLSALTPIYDLVTLCSPMCDPTGKFIVRSVPLCQALRWSVQKVSVVRLKSVRRSVQKLSGCPLSVRKVSDGLSENCQAVHPEMSGCPLSVLEKKWDPTPIHGQITISGGTDRPDDRTDGLRQTGRMA